MKKTGKLKVNSKLSGLIKAGKTKYSIPKYYNLSPREKYNNKECEFELEGGTVASVWVNGQELPKDEQILEEQVAKEQKRAAREAAQQRKKALKNDFRGDSFKMEKAQVPSDTRQTVISEAEFDNFALKLNRFAHFDENDKDGKFKFFQQDRKKGDFEIRANFDNVPTKANAERSLEAAKRLCGEDDTYSIILKTDWRLIIGLGGTSVYETDMTLHHLYGIPYIPGSAVKGVVRSWYYTKYFAEKAEEEKEISEGLALKDATFCDLFGCPAEALLQDDKGKKRTYKSHYEEARMGQILFFDAFPVQSPVIETDIMNPHYPADKPPVDYNDPVPVPFLTVAKTPFRFIIGLRPSQMEQKEGLLDKAKKLLEEALVYKGIGAKTAVGYGYMNESKN